MIMQGLTVRTIDKTPDSLTESGVNFIILFCRIAAAVSYRGHTFMYSRRADM